jgi:hypothetical protein
MTVKNQNYTKLSFLPLMFEHRKLRYGSDNTLKNLREVEGGCELPVGREFYVGFAGLGRYVTFYGLSHFVTPIPSECGYEHVHLPNRELPPRSRSKGRYWVEDEHA